MVSFLLFLHHGFVFAESVCLIYTSNINAALQNCACGPNPLGGVGRVKQVIDQIKREKERVIVIDGGDYFNSYPYRPLNQVMLESLDIINFDLMVPGEQEFIEGKDFFNKFFEKNRDKIILTNQISDFRHKKIFKRENFDLNIYAFLSPAVFDYIQKPDFLCLSEDLSIEDPLSSDRNFDILVLHGTKEEAQKIISKHPGFEVILLAHDQRRGTWNVEGTTIVGNGKDSEYISLIELKSGNKKKIEVRLIEINESISENTEIKYLIDKFNNHASNN